MQRQKILFKNVETGIELNLISSFMIRLNIRTKFDKFDWSIPQLKKKLIPKTNNQMY